MYPPLVNTNGYASPRASSTPDHTWRRRACGTVRQRVAIGVSAHQVARELMVGSRLLRGLHAEQTGGPEDHHDDEDREDDDVRPLDAEELPAERLDQPDYKRAGHRAGDVADPAQDRGGKRAEPG